MTIYRGYDIDPRADGQFNLCKDGGFISVHPTEDAAMDEADALKRQARRAFVECENCGGDASWVKVEDACCDGSIAARRI